jgi:hypothetical protein
LRAGPSPPPEKVAAAAVFASPPAMKDTGRQASFDGKHTLWLNNAFIGTFSLEKELKKAIQCRIYFHIENMVLWAWIFAVDGFV